MSTYQPILEISQLMLAFTQTSADKPCFQLLTVAQQYANTPVTIETDAPDYFQLATDSQPTFKPALTFVPSPEGSYVHVRYSSPRRASVRARLTIHSPYDSQVVMLEGKPKGMLATVQKVVSGSQPLQLGSAPDASSRKRWVAVVGVALLSGLTYAGFRYQCELFPGLCKSTSAEEHATSLFADPALKAALIREQSSLKLPPAEVPVTGNSSTRLKKGSNLEVRQEKNSSVRKADTPAKENKVVNRRKFDSTVLGKESELERELNKQPDSK